MKYHLRHQDAEAVVQLIPQVGNSHNSRFTAALKLGEESKDRKIFYSHDLLQVEEPDGSLRRLPFTVAQLSPDCIQFFHQGRPRSVLSVGGVGGRVESSQAEGAVSAPMNGQVVKVPAKVGDAVECGEIILILEAMKMENEVTAPISGVLAEMSVSPGQTVSPGQAMFVIEAAE